MPAKTRLRGLLLMQVSAPDLNTLSRTPARFRPDTPAVARSITTEETQTICRWCPRLRSSKSQDPPRENRSTCPPPPHTHTGHLSCHSLLHLELWLPLVDERLVLRRGQVDLAQELVGDAQCLAPAVQGHPKPRRAALHRAVRPCLPLLRLLRGVHAPGKIAT